MSCDILKGLATGIEPVIVSLTPNVDFSLDWDFTDCGTSIHNFTLLLTQPRAKNGMQKKLAVTPTANIFINGIWRQGGAETTFYLGTVTNAKLMLKLLAPKAVTVEVSFTCVMGG